MRIKGHKVYITEDVISYMNKIVGIGNESTVKIDDGWCGAESGEIPQTCIASAVKVKGIDLMVEKLERPMKRPLIPIPKK